jgi:DNA-binding transcriptional LysR family regulator
VRLDLYTLKLFVSVIDHGSIAAAAQREHIAVSALSKRLADMERQFGLSVLLRKARGVEATATGLMVAAKARVLLRMADELIEEIGDLADGVSGHIRVAANISALTQFLPRDLLSFQRAQPNIEVDIDERISTAVMKAVADNQADIGICIPQDLSSYDLKVYSYHHDALTLVVPEDHPLADREQASLEEALEYDFIGMHKGSALNELLIREASRLKRKLRLKMQVSSYDAVVAMVRGGMGIGVIPAGVIDALDRPSRLKFVKLLEPWARRDLVLCVRDELALPASASLLLMHLRASAGHHSPAVGLA